MTIYYVDIDSIGGVASDGNVGTSLAQPWKTLGKANSVLTAGDTVNIRAGTYLGERIQPVNSGSFGNYITYQKYPSDFEWSVIITDGGLGIKLETKSYIVVDGLYFYLSRERWVLLDNADYNILQNCKFYDSRSWSGINVYNGSSYNVIKNNIFPDTPASGNKNGTSPADFIQFSPGANPNNYNVIEGNTFGNCRHNIMFIDKGNHTVIRCNTFQNQYHTGLNLNDDGPNLIEDNYFYDQGNLHEESPIPDKPNLVNDPAIQLNGTYNIIRKNIFDNNGSGISQSTYALARTKANYNRVYNNTINKGVIPMKGVAVDANYMVGNEYKNNIFTNAEESTVAGDSYPEPFNLNYRDNNGGNNRFYNNCSYGQNDHRFRTYYPHTFAEIIAQYPTSFPSGNVTVDPLYVNVSTRNFALQSTSPLINTGSFLTTITSSTNPNQTTIVVDDATYFYDGWGIPGEVGDTIKTAGGEETVIQSINYGTNTIIVNPAIDIKNSEGLALTYNDFAPDIGAYEYEGVVCNDFCDGTTRYYNGVYDPTAGECLYQEEVNSEICGYDPCKGVICDDICIGTTRYYNGVCINGECFYEIEPNSETCGYVPPDLCEGVVCEDICIGNDLYSQKCDPDTGECINDQLLESNSETCKIPTDEDTITKYLMLGGLGLIGYMMLSKK